VLGSINDAPYTGGPVVITSDVNGVYNPVFDLNDSDTANDGLGHTG
jgi:hypothetical protein